MPNSLNRLVFTCVLAVAAPFALVQGAERSGKEVVEAVCAACHAKGEQGAPRIGDRKAWSKRASQGLTSLTQSALTGIRKMPSHGGKLELTDLEIGKAVAYMVNQSGGRWTEPASRKDMAAERTGKQVAEAQCAKCHKDGTGGAPKIGDRDAWKTRLSQGIDSLVRSAIRGHGGMPPRGDKADLTDGELRNAILYMYNPSAPPKSAPAAGAPKPTGMHRSVGGMDVYLGIVPAGKLRAFPVGSVERTMHGGVPSGSGNYHVNVSLLDAASKERIADAKVEVRVEQPGLSGETKALEQVVINKVASYGNYVRMAAKATHVVTVRITRPGSSQQVEAKFDFKS